MGKLNKLLASTVDWIADDEKFMEAEYDIIHNYCRKQKYQMDKSDMESIIARGIEDSYNTWKQAYIEEIWFEFGDIAMNPETECIEESWNGFPAGTHREEIWHWFEETFNLCVAEDLMELQIGNNGRREYK